jgi:anti-sigma B factor antagonist
MPGRGPQHVQLDEVVDDAGVVVHVAGDLDLLSAPELALHLDPHVRRGTGDVTVDLRRVTFLDSTGLAVLLNALRRLTRQGRAMRVRCPPGQARDVIERARLAQTLGLD